MASDLQTQFRAIVHAALAAAREVYGERLTSFAVFGSVARGSMRSDSDIDLLLVVDPLPDGRMARVREFAEVESKVATLLADLRKRGIYTILVPVFKTTQELKHGSLLFLDMVEEAEIRYDRDATLRSYLDDLAARLRKMGAQRVRKGGGYYWRLKPDLKPGEKIVL